MVIICVNLFYWGRGLIVNFFFLIFHLTRYYNIFWRGRNFEPQPLVRHCTPPCGHALFTPATRKPYAGPGSTDRVRWTLRTKLNAKRRSFSLKPLRFNQTFATNSVQYPSGFVLQRLRVGSHHDQILHVPPSEIAVGFQRQSAETRSYGSRRRCACNVNDRVSALRPVTHKAREKILRLHSYIIVQKYDTAVFGSAYRFRFHFRVHVDGRHPVVTARRPGAVRGGQRRRTFLQVPRFAPVKWCANI